MLSATFKRVSNCGYLSSVLKNSRMCFHTAQPVLVRKVTGKSLRSSFDAQPATTSVDESGPIDFFGIESDVGVIFVREKATNNSEKTTNNSEKANDPVDSSSPDSKEHFLRTPFGHLRFDSDNHPTFHGQYDENVSDTMFSYGRNRHTQNIRNLEPSEIRRNVNKLEEFYAVTSGKNRMSESFVPLCEAISPEISLENSDAIRVDDNRRSGTPSSSGVVNECNDSLGFIDREYFGDGANDGVGSHIAFSNAATNYKEHLEQDSSAWRNQNDDEVKGLDTGLLEKCSTDGNSHGKASYVDSVYFRELYAITDSNLSNSSNKSDGSESSSTVLEKGNQTDGCADRCSDLETQRKVSTDSSFIDSVYFGTPTMTSNSTFHEENHDVISQNDLHIVHKTSDHSSIPANALPEKIAPNGVVKSDQEPEEDFSFSRQSHLLSVAENEMASLQDFSKATKSGDLQRLIKSAERRLKILETSVNASKDLECFSEDTPATAYNYVLKLRDDEVKKDVQTGHKELKNQVPDLSRLTRSELINLLKDNVLFSNEDIVILNKPYNLVIHESQTTKQPCLSSVLDDFASRLDTSSGHPQLYTVHRLDRETTGCLLLARNELTANRLKSFFARHEIEKTYVVVTAKVPDPPEGVIDIPIAEGKVGNKVRMVLQPDLPSEMKYKSHVKNGKKAITYYKVISTSGNAAFVEVKPETGVKHQIRVHFGFGLNCPILGDHKYSHLTKLAPQRLLGDTLRKLDVKQSKVRHIPMHIHAQTVIIPKFLGEDDLIISAPLPDHIRATLKRLKCKLFKM